MKRVFLIRHPHVKAAEEDLCYGASEVELSEQGHKQAQAIVGFLSGHKLDAVYASDLSRAVLPGEMLAEDHKLKLQLTPGLREVHCGDWEGVKYSRLRERYPEIYQRWFSLDGSFTFPGGEKISDFQARVLKTFKSIVENGAGEADNNIAVITHGGVNRIILMDLLNIPWRSAWKIGQDFAAVNIIDYYHDGNATLQLLNGGCQSDCGSMLWTP